MKKISLIIFILTFSFASAQQNEFFDIQKHLEKKQKEAKKSQFRIKPFSEKLMASYTASSLQPRLIDELPNGNKVYALPQDHMPCIKPDMNQFNMLNAFKENNQFPLVYKNRAGKIPNPAIPLSLEKSVR